MNSIVEPRSHEGTKVLEPESKTARSKAEPELRFAEFSDDWERKSLSQVCEMKAGKFVKASDISEVKNDVMYPCYGGNGLRGYTRTKTHYGQYPLIGRQGALCGNVQLANGEFHATEHAVVVNSNEENNSIWLYYQLDKLNLNRFATGQAQPGLSVDVIQKVKAFFPLHAEQQKIADFLSSVDTKIEQLTEKHRLLTEYKKSVMQQIFTQQIRFKDNQGNDYPEWELTVIGSVFEQRTERYQEGLELLSVTMNNGVKKRSEIDAKDNSSENKSNYKKVCAGDIVYNSMRMWQGASGVSLYEGVVSPAYTVLKANELNSSEFFGYYFKTTKMVQTFQRNSQGLTSDTWNLKYKPLSKIKVLVPVREEQQKIVKFLTEIDQKIDQAWSTLEQTKAFKKGLLQKMFV